MTVQRLKHWTFSGGEREKKPQKHLTELLLKKKGC
jgi:hypothetical protein